MKLSIILPTYNNEKTIDECLRSVFIQEFSKRNFEVLLIDGGSNDKTLDIAKKYPIKLIHNPKRNEEAARILGINEAKGDILCFIDADNVLEGKDWIKRMLEPFSDKEIIFADTLYYGYRKTDDIKVRYQVLIGGDDPFIMYLGGYSRYNYLYNNWTGYDYKKQEKGEYIKVKLSKKNFVPPMGSNGWLVRRKILKKFVRDSFIHSDIVHELVNYKEEDYNCFAKVKTGIVHNQPKFFPNKIRRAKRRANNEIKMNYNYGITNKDLVRVSAYMLLFFPVIYDSLRGFLKKPDLAWFFHPIACFGELGIYIYYFIKSGQTIK